MDNEAHELIAAYALDALDAEGQAQAKALLAESQEARDELRSLSAVTAALALGAVGPTPTPGLRERILVDASAEPQRVVPLERRRDRPTLKVVATVAAVAAVVAIGLGLWARSLSTELDSARTALDRSRAAATILADPSAQDVSLATGAGRLVVSDTGRAVLVVEGLAPAPAGKTYETWVIDGDTPAPAGTFTGDGQRQLVAVEGMVAPGAVVAVTVEDAGGVSQPTTKPVVASDPV